MTQPSEFADAYMNALREAADDISGMKEAKAHGEDLAPGLPEQVTGPISFRFLDDLPSRSPENNAWDIEFSWEDGASHATFTLWFAPSQNMGGDEPEAGWVSWVDGDLLVAFVDYNGPHHDAMHLKDGSPFVLRASEQEGAAWLQLARTLLRVMFGESEAQSILENL